MHNVGAGLLGHEREPGLLPRQPRRPVRDGGGARDDVRVRDHPGVPLFVGALAGDHQVSPAGTQRDHEPVDVTSQRPAIRGDRGRVN